MYLDTRAGEQDGEYTRGDGGVDSETETIERGIGGERRTAQSGAHESRHGSETKPTSYARGV